MHVNDIKEQLMEAGATEDQANKAAKKHLSIDSLEAMGTDSEDFKDVSQKQMKKALEDIKKQNTPKISAIKDSEEVKVSFMGKTFYTDKDGNGSIPDEIYDNDEMYGKLMKEVEKHFDKELKNDQ